MDRPAVAVAMLVAVAVLCTSSPADPPVFVFVPASSVQPGGPEYDFRIGQFEITNTQFVEFLNDAMGNLGNPRGFYLSFSTSTGDVHIAGSQEGHIVTVGNGTLVFGASANPYVSYDGTEERYVVESGYEDHPACGVTWYGAVKYCNWLTLFTGLAAGDRTYTEAVVSEPEGWHPVTISTEDWALRDLSSDERDALLDVLGYRLPMDGGDGGTDPGPYNEWYKAASWNEALGANTVYGFGRDAITDADANYRCSHDPFEDEFDCIIGGTTPVGYFDGVNTLADGTDTADTGNTYSLYDMSGNAWEWVQDQGFDQTDRGNRGGSWCSSTSSLRTTPGAERSADTAVDSTGFRVVQSVICPLLVEPNKELVNSGPWGGPYEEDDTELTFQVTNVTDQPVDLTVTSDVDWLTITDDSGGSAIPAGDSVSVTVAIEPQCQDEMVVGENVAVVTFSNDVDETTIERTVRLTVVEPLALTPPDGFVASIYFDEDPPTKVYDLTSSSEQTVQWSASWEDTTNPPTGIDWLTVTDLTGEVQPLGATEITIGFDKEGLDPGTYTALVTIVDECTGTEFVRGVSFEIKSMFEVAPVEEVISIGVTGGPFVPSDHVFTLRNLAHRPVDWSVALDSGQSVDWIAFDPAEGTLAYYDDEIEVTIAITDGANDEAVGLHTAKVLFEQPLSGFVVERLVTIDVRELMVEPEEDATFSGPQGGPFLPATFTYTLTNTGLVEMPWEATFVDTTEPAPGVEWLVIHPTAGTILDPAGTVEIELSITAAAASLPQSAEAYTGQFTVTSTVPDPEVSTVRDVRLTIGSEPLALAMVDVPGDDAQPGGPSYLFRIGRYEVTNAEFVRFLNDARAFSDEPRGSYLDHDTEQVIITLTGDDTVIFDANVGEAIDFVDGQYVVLDDKESFPVVGVSWYGAAKFSNWLTLIQGMGLDERCYTEGPTVGDWFPVFSAAQLVDRHGFRLPMDEQSPTASTYNEWYKAAAWNGAAQQNRLYGFGCDILTNADANYLDSGDPYEPGPSPVGFFNGVNRLADDSGTNDTDNAYGLYDITGNVAEWIHDGDDATGEQTTRGGHFDNVDVSIMLQTEGRTTLAPGSIFPYVGFRVVQVYEPQDLVVAQSAVRSEGYVGGPFDPESFTLTITNPAAHTVDQVTVASSADWLEIEGGPVWQIGPGASLDVTLKPSAIPAILGVTPPPPGDFAYVSREDAQPDGPDYDYWINRTEVRNDQFAVFLNDVRDNALSEDPDERSWHLYFDAVAGSVYVNDEQTGEEGTNPPSSTFLYDASTGRIQLINDRYEVAGGYGLHPVVGVTWYGAVKYCNWLSAYTSIPSDLWAYTESTSDNLDGWHPITVTDAEWITGGFGAVARGQLITQTLGYRLPMDDEAGGASAFNEWYKSAAWDSGANDGAGGNHVYGFGRDALTGVDANFFESGETETDGTTPVRFFNGVNAFYAPEEVCPPQPDPIMTVGTDNFYGLYDACGDVAEWTQEFVAGDPSLRATRGGSWRDDVGSDRLAADGRGSQLADMPSDDTGFRVVRGMGRPVTVYVTDSTLDETYALHFVVEALEPFTVTPSDEIEIEGTYGDAFHGATGSSQTYTLTNNSASQMAWLVSVDQDWIDVAGPEPDELAGTIEAAEQLAFQIALHADADDLGPGEHEAVVTFRNQSTGQSEVRNAKLTIEQPIAVTPGQESAAFSGYWMGPFDNPPDVSYQLTSVVDFDLQYTVSTPHDWITIEPADALTGTLQPDDVLVFTITIAEIADTYNVGSYDGTARFTFTDPANENLGDTIEETVRLIVMEPIEVEAEYDPWPSEPNPDPNTHPPQTYTLTNNVSVPIDVIASVDVDWLDIVPESVEVAPDQSEDVTVSLNENAARLFDGVYTAALTVEDAVTGDQRCIPIELVINEVMSVGPFDDFIASGVAGVTIGPSFMVYTLTNVERGNPGDIHWMVSTQPPGADWLSINGGVSSEGDLPDGVSTNVVIYIDVAMTTGLVEGVHTAVLEFTADDGVAPVTVTRQVSLSLVVPAFMVQESNVSTGAVQPAGPSHPYAIARFHTTNAEFVAFLNNAMSNLDNERGRYMFFDSLTGDVYINTDTTGQVGDDPGVRTVKLFSPAVSGQIAFTGGQYDVVTTPNDTSNHPITGVSWYGAVKYANWLTLDQGMLASEQCYTESDHDDLTGWHPAMTTKTEWEARDLDDAERAELVAEYRGYRLPMDNGYNNPDVTSDFADPYNEWYKAAAWHDALGTNTIYGFGADTLTGDDANYRDSGDAFDNGTTPADFYTNNGNGFGIHDMSGNAFQWMQGRYNTHPSSIDFRTIRGGSWDVPETSLSLKTTRRMFTAPTWTDNRIGFRVVRALTVTTGDVDHDGDVDWRDFAGTSVCLTGPDPGDVPIPACEAYDLDADADVDLADVATFQNAFTGSQ